jgi:UrcA family protein
MNKTAKIILSSFLITAGIIKGAPALAEEMQTATYVVRTADLDLNTAAGQRALDHRLTIAIAEVCGVASDADLVGKNAANDCRTETRAKLEAERDQRLAGLVAPTSPIRIASR